MNTALKIEEQYQGNSELVTAPKSQHKTKKHYKLTEKAKRTYQNILGVVMVTAINYLLLELVIRCFE